MENKDQPIKWPMSVHDMRGQGYPDWHIGLSFRISIAMQAKGRANAAAAAKEKAESIQDQVIENYKTL